MKERLKKGFFSFACSSICGAVVNLLIEIIVRTVTGLQDFNPMSPAFVNLFPSVSIALEVNILLYGIIGFVFAMASAVYERENIGFIVQNIIYVLITGFFWIPILTLLWQLQRYPSALIGTLCGYTGSYIIISLAEYHSTKKNVEKINQNLSVKYEESIL